MSMIENERSQSTHIDSFDDWMEHFYIDPFTTYLDEYIFRIDLFETEKEYMIEAYLPNFSQEQLELIVKNDHIIIRAITQINDEEGKISEKKYERTVTYPFQLPDEKISFNFSNDVLEIKIHK